MSTKIELRILEDAASFVQNKLRGATPVAAMILGSGWGDVASAFEIKTSIPYSDIPGLGNTGVKGHVGKLHLATVREQEIFIFQGRRHYYEGEGWTPVAIPPFILKSFNVSKVLLTNAAGGLNPTMQPGDVMIIKDHINLMGGNPLLGPHLPCFGERFLDQSAVYDPNLRKLLQQSAERPMFEGVYLALSGPAYETPAEIRLFANSGVDAVGMSIVPEAMLCNGAGLKVGALSCITNLAAGISKVELSHSEVIETTSKTMGKLTNLITRFFGALVGETE